MAIAPDCAHTVMTGADGRVLYSGISHGLSGARLTDEETAGAGDPHRLRHGDPGAPAPGDTALLPGAVDIARAVAARALRSDAEKFTRACDGEVVDLELVEIPIMQCKDTPAYTAHWSTLPALEENPLTLSIRDGDGRTRNVSANVRFQRVPIVIGEIRHDRVLHPDSDAMCKLLGPPGNRELSGELSEKIDARKARAADRWASIVRELQSDRPADEHVPEGGSLQDELRTRAKELACLERDSRTLEQAGMDVKARLTGRRGAPGIEELGVGTAARIALISSMTGRTPVLCYATDRDLAMRVESEIESLLGSAGAHEGNIPMLQAQPQPRESAGAKPTPR